MVWARNTGHVVGMDRGTHGMSHCGKVAWAKAPGATDLLGKQSSILILHCPVLSKHVIKLLNDFRDTQRPREKETA